jgi:hypothetical protein
MLQDAFRRLGLGRDPDDVALVRQSLEHLPAHHYVQRYRESAPDLAHDSGIADTFLHPQDRAFTVPEVLGLVAGSGLEFQGWLDNSLYYPAARVPPRSPLRARIEALPIEEQWAVVEHLDPTNACHYFVARRRGEAPAAIDFSGPDWLGYSPVVHPALTIVADPPDGGLGQATLRRGWSTWSVTSAEAALLRAANGTRTIERLVEHPALAAHDLAIRIMFAQRFFQRMWERGHVFMRVPSAPANNSEDCLERP